MLKHLTIAEMVALLAPWVGKGPLRRTFLAIPEIAALHPKVEEAHRAMLAVRPAEDPSLPAVRALQQAGEAIARRHDPLLRCVPLFLQAERWRCLASDPPDTARADLCAATERALFPDGLLVINASFLTKAGNASRVAKLLEEQPSLASFLATLPVAGKKGSTLRDTVEAWLRAGRELDDLEHERSLLLSRRALPAPRATLAAARSRWFKLVRAVLESLSLSSAPPDAIESIRGPLLRASERAGRRYASERVEARSGTTAEPGGGPL